MTTEELSAAKQSLAAIQGLQAKLAALQAERHEPIAIIGMACRFPGASNDPEEFWRFLRRGEDAVRRVAGVRWPDGPLDDAADPELRASQWLAMIEQSPEHFDAAYFGIAPREALLLDPQQRLLLEVVWEALQRAGIVAERLMGSQTGVFVGMMTDDYKQMCYGEAGTHDVYTFTGNGHCFPPGRISYLLGLHGPSMAIDTACSSSLVAVHQACQSLRTRESELAIAGGVSLHLSQTTMQVVARTQALSPDGRCKTFDAAANGYVRGEGCGVLVLKRLSDAQRAGDRVLAQIRGSAVNQDGRSTGLTAPNVLAQQAMLRQALRNARVDASEISYVETHGTGTALGDPIEYEALKEVLGEPAKGAGPCLLGALKPNIGHLEPASGVAGLIKTVLCLQHEEILPNIHFKRLNPRIVLDGTRFALALERKAWTRGERPRIAGVSSFGMSGTNAHVIVQEAPLRASESAARAPLGAQVLTLSCKSAEACREQARRYSEYVGGLSAEELGDVLYTANRRRSQHKHRVSVVGTSAAELSAGLRSYAEGRESAGVFSGESRGSSRKVVFVFPGQGSQWEGMARELLLDSGAFSESVRECDAAIGSLAGWSVRAVLEQARGSRSLDEIDVVQPVLFAVAVGLAAHWRSLGVEAEALVGHSMGEVAAAYVGGGLSLEDAARVISFRSRLLRQRSGCGAMGLVELGLEQAREELRGLEEVLSVAVSNSTRSTVLAGEPVALDAVLSKLTSRGVFCRRVKVDVASHSPQMDGLLPELRSALSVLKPQALRIPMLSTVSGQWLEGVELDGEYWARNLREPVLFGGAVRTLLGSGHDAFIELSPHPILSPSVQESIAEQGSSALSLTSMRRNENERRTLLEAAAELYAHGHALDWSKLHPEGAVVAALPTYPWQRERFWFDAGASRASGVEAGAAARGASGAWPGQELALALPQTRVWQLTLSSDEMPLLKGHRVLDQVIFPASGYLELALRAAVLAFGARPLTLRNARFEQPLPLPSGVSVPVQVVLSDIDASGADVKVLSQHVASGTWTLHASMRLTSAEDAAPVGFAGPQTTGTLLDGSAFYEATAQLGIQYSDAFQRVQQLRVERERASGQVRGLSAESTDGAAAAAVLDACFQVAASTLLSSALAGNEDDTFVARGVDALRVLRPLEGSLEVRAKAVSTTDDPIWEIQVFDAHEQLVLEGRGLRASRLGDELDQHASSDFYYAASWQLANAPVDLATARGSSWLVLLDRSRLGLALVALLRARGATVVAVAPARANRRLEPSLFEMESGSERGLAWVLEQAFPRGQRCSGVVDLRALDATPPSRTSATTLVEDQERSVEQTLLDVQAIMRHSFEELPRLVLVTRGVQTIAQPSAHEVAFSQASTWGLGMVLSIEHPELACKRIDLNAPRPGMLDWEAEALVRELFASDTEDQVVLHDGGRFAPRLVSTRPAERTRPLSIRQDGTYVIAGGLGGVGAALAQWLAGQGAGHLVLLGRSPDSPAAEQTIERLSAGGARVSSVRCDVSDARQVETAIADLARDGETIRGVFHAAAVLDDATVLEQTAERFRTVMAPKMLGAWNLHQATRALDLDCFVLFSSAASLVGSPGQANYVAANSLLDAFASYRHSIGLPALAVNWGAFAKVGLAASDVRRDRLGDRGALGMTTKQAFGALRRVMETQATRIGIMRFEVSRWLRFLPARVAGSPYWSVLREAAPAENARAPEQLRDELRLLPRAAGLARVQAEVLQQLSLVTRQQAERIDVRRPFVALGLDSLMSLELRNRLERVFGLKLVVTTLFLHPDPAALTQHVYDLLQSAPARDGAQARHSARDSAADARRHDRLIAARSLGDEAHTTLFCIPGAGASSSFYGQWLSHAPAALEVALLELPGRGARLEEAHPGRLEDIVGELVELLARTARPFAIFAHSMGSLVAFELTRQLEQRERPPLHLFVSAFSAPRSQPSTPLSAALALPDREFLAMARRLGFVSSEISRRYDDEIMRSYLPTLRGDIDMLSRYEASGGPIRTPVTVFGAADDTLIERASLDGWRSATSGPVAMKLFAGDHFFVRDTAPELLAEVAARLAAPGA